MVSKRKERGKYKDKLDASQTDSIFLSYLENLTTTVNEDLSILLNLYN